MFDLSYNDDSFWITEQSGRVVVDVGLIQKRNRIRKKRIRMRNIVSYDKIRNVFTEEKSCTWCPHSFC
jgi:hypothetical protein